MIPKASLHRTASGLRPSVSLGACARHGTELVR
jgi:hypothetical protein